MTSRNLLLAGTALATAFALSLPAFAQSTDSADQTQTAQADAAPKAATTSKKKAAAAKAPSITELEREIEQMKSADQAQIRALQSQVDALKAQVNQNEQKATLTQERASAANAELVKEVSETKKKAAEGTGLTWNGITLYGIYDVGVTYLTHGAPTSDYLYTTEPYLIRSYSRGATFSVSGDAMSQSRVGLRGVEKIDGDWSGIFQAEVNFVPTSGNLADALKSVTLQNGLSASQKMTGDDGSRAGEAFSGQLWGGVAHPVFGQLTFGRQNSLENSLIAKYDSIGGAYAFGYIEYSGTAAGGGRTEDARWDDSIKYSNKVGPIRVDAMYKSAGFGSDGIGGAGGGAWAFGLGTDYHGFSLDGTYGKIHDEISAGALSAAQVEALVPGTTAANAPAVGAGILGTTVSGTVSDNEAYQVAASYKFDPMFPAKIAGGYEHIEYSNPTHPLAAGTETIGGYILGVVNNTNFNNHEDVEIYWLGGTYDITEKLQARLMWNHFHTNSYGTNAQVAACASNKLSSGNCAGDLDTYALVFDYRLSKRFDTYLGAMYSKVTDGQSVGFLNTNTMDPTIGMRFQF